ncbi:MAG: hypothetical protein R3Y23_06120 [Bacillota bacterium]
MECEFVVAESGNNITASVDATLLGTNENFELSVSRNSFAIKRKPLEKSNFLDIFEHKHSFQMMCLGDSGKNETMDIELNNESLVIMQNNLSIELEESGFEIKSRAFFKKENARTDRFNITIKGAILAN